MRSLFLLICLCLACAVPVLAATLGPLSDRAAAFQLQDQYEKEHSYCFPRSRVSVLVFADREGSEQIEGWVRPLYERYQDTIDIHGVANLKGVPTFAQGLVRKIFRKSLQYPVMLDWTGDVATSYESQSGMANLILLSKEGAVAFRITGASNQEKLQQCFNAIDRLLPEGASPR